MYSYYLHSISTSIPICAAAALGPPDTEAAEDPVVMLLCAEHS